jgi:predicted nuclease of predicted toxin-antitoxin system
MNLLLDQGLPRSTVEHLRRAGILAEHISDINLATASDALILQKARERNATIVTLDADFHQTLAASRATSPSVVRIRIEGLNGERRAAVLVQVVQVTATELERGAVVSVTPARQDRTTLTDR